MTSQNSNYTTRPEGNSPAQPRATLVIEAGGLVRLFTGETKNAQGGNGLVSLLECTLHNVPFGFDGRFIPNTVRQDGDTMISLP